jgi:lysozyme
MKVSDRGIFALALHEGIVPAPYLDSVNVWTFGIGHTSSAGDPDPATMPRGNPENLDAVLPEVFAVFRRDLARFEKRVNDAVRVPMAQHEFDALVSFDFNTGGVHRAQLTKHLNNGDRAGAARGFMGWLRPPEIRDRREGEMRLFRDGTYPTGLVSVFGVTDGNRPDFRQVRRRLTQDQVLAYMRGNAAPATQPASGGLWAALGRIFGGRA